MKNQPNFRKLSKNTRTITPQYFCFVDTETTQEKVSERKTLHHLMLGVAYFVRYRQDTNKHNVDVFRFINANDFWNKVVNFAPGKNTLHIISHNALFDMTILKNITTLTRLEFNCQFVYESGIVFISNWRKDDQRIIILDNSNWFKGKLEEWGKVLGLPKLKMPDKPDNQEKWFAYCQRDAEILWKLQEWLLEFIENNDLGHWRYTLGALSFNAYRHRFMNYPIYIPEKSRETHLARMSYRGGRTECFKMGEWDNDRFYKLDVNSMYPSVMLKHRYPTCALGYDKNPSIQKVMGALDTVCAIAFCRVNTTQPYFPHKRDNHTCFPIGGFSTYLTTPELRLALKNGWIEKIHEIAYYRARPIFKEFVTFFYNERLKCKKEGDELRSLVFKLMLNSLYGKFGQRGYEDKILGECEPGEWPLSYGYDAVTGTRSIIRQIGRNVIQNKKIGEGKNAFVAIASHVTAYARLYLYSLVIRASRENCFYCDTDSIIVNQQGFNRLCELLNPLELGMLKIEGKSATLAIKASKHYRFGGKWTIKGVRKNADILEKNVYQQEVWPGLNKILQSKEEVYFNYLQQKELQPQIHSGTVSADGTINPFVLKES